MKITLRDWATPMVAGAFLLSATTGILIFFHWDTGLNKAAHEWLGWALVLGVAAHLASNFAGFQKRFAAPLSKIIIGVFAAVLLLSFIPAGKDGEGSPVRASLDALTAAPLSSVALIAKKDVNALISELQAGGIVITADQSLGDVLPKDREATMDALRIVFKTAP